MEWMKARSSIIVIIWICVFPSSIVVARKQTPQFRYKVDKSVLLSQFQNQLFSQLNSNLESLQQAFEEDYQAEDYVFDAFEAFRKSSPSSEPIFNDWIQKFPASYAPYVARAEYTYALAATMRGNKRVLDKEQKEYAEMERYCSQALRDIDEALKLNAGLDVCYALQIEIGLAVENETLISQALAEASKQHPYAYRVRLQFLQTMTPWNGGSYEKMEGFLISCKKIAVFNPKITELSASIPAEKGKIFSYLGKYEQAVNMYSEALKLSNHHSYYVLRGDAYAQLHQYKLALDDYNRALELSPNDPEYLKHKSQAISSQNQMSTKSTVRKEVGDDPYKDWPPKKLSTEENAQAMTYVQKATELLSDGQYEQAIPQFTNAIRFFPHEYSLYHNRGLCYLQLKKDDSALQDFLLAIQKKPEDFEAYVRITFIYANRGAYDDALKYINSAIKLKPTSGEPFYLRSKIFARKGMNVEAIEDARKACAMGYQRACNEYNLGK